jgi:hypothetical protein
MENQGLTNKGSAKQPVVNLPQLSPTESPVARQMERQIQQFERKKFLLPSWYIKRWRY